jgi:hypothetical protein
MQEEGGPLAQSETQSFRSSSVVAKTLPSRARAEARGISHMQTKPRYLPCVTQPRSWDPSLALGMTRGAKCAPLRYLDSFPSPSAKSV